MPVINGASGMIKKNTNKNVEVISGSSALHTIEKISLIEKSHILYKSSSIQLHNISKTITNARNTIQQISNKINYQRQLINQRTILTSQNTNTNTLNDCTVPHKRKNLMHCSRRNNLHTPNNNKSPTMLSYKEAGSHN